MMDKAKLIISPKTKVGEFLEAYPWLENTLTEMSPAFAKLKNPILRKTIGRVATLQQAAAIGGLKVDELVNRLRKEEGQAEYSSGSEEAISLPSEAPLWLDELKIVSRYDATPVINSGGSPMGEIMQKAGQLKEGEIFSFSTPFVPAPLIDMLQKKGFVTFSRKNGDEVVTFIKKK